MQPFLRLVALALAIPQVNAAAQTSEVRVFLGYENQRADLAPSKLSALDGWAISLERMVPPSAGSLLLDIRGGSRSGAFSPGFCELLPTPPCVPPTVHTSNFQLLLLSGLRASVSPRGVRLFADGLGGIGYQRTSRSGTFLPVGRNTGWSPAVEAGAGVDAAIRRHIDARVRASWLYTDFDDDLWQSWRHHVGLTAGIVLRP